MTNGVPNREIVRQYLLGRLDEQEQLENKVSDDIVLKDDLSEMVDSIEDEIIEDYAEETLDSADRKAVEEYFLRPPDRQEKLRFYKILRHHLETKPANVEQQAGLLSVRSEEKGRARADGQPRFSWGTRILVYGQAAALLALCILGWTYVSGIREKQVILEAKLGEERTRAASLAAEVSQLHPPLVMLTLVSDRSRDTRAQLPRVDINPSTQRILVEIALAGSRAGSFNVRLETREGKGPIWAAKLLPLLSPAGDAKLIFDLPAKNMQPGFYSFVVSSSDGSAAVGPRYYDFEAREAK